MSEKNEKVAVNKALIRELLESHRAYLGEKDLENSMIELEGVLAGKPLEEWDNHEPLSDEEQEEMGSLIAEGYTSGQFGADGTSIAWELNWNKWEEE